MTRCHDGDTYVVPASPTRTINGRDTLDVSALEDVAVCCATCHTVLAVGPRTEVHADL